MTKCGACQFCTSPTAHGNTSVCPACINNIVSRGLAGESMRSIALDYGATRNSIIGLFGRNKPEGSRHPGGAVYAPRKPRPIRVMKVTADIYGPPTNPNNSDGCKWIDHDGERVYGKHPRDSQRRYCQAKEQRGSSYCPEHHARVWVSPAKAKADRHAAEAAGTATKFIPRLSRRAAPQAHQ